MANRTADVSGRTSAGRSASIVYMAGTAEKYVARLCSSRSKNVFGLKRPATVARPPASSGDNVPTTIPLAWNSGRMSRLWSSLVILNASIAMRHMAFRLAWSSMTPFGRPVVPLV